MNYDYLSSASMSDVGQRRKNNQDAEIRVPEAGIFCVADGMGGGDAGEVASGKVVEAVKAFSDKLHEEPGVDNLKYKVKYLSRTLITTGEDIFQYARKKGYNSCGTTAVILAFDLNQPRQAGVLHVGDSRLYRLRNEEFKQITVDHSAENEADIGDRELPESMKHVITRAIGVHAYAQVEENQIDVEPDDLYLICSDGLSGMLSDDEMKTILVKNIENPPGHSIQDLVAAANQAGGKDNITAVLVRVRHMPGFDQVPGQLEPYEMEEEDTADRSGIRAAEQANAATQNIGAAINPATVIERAVANQGPVRLDMPAEKEQKSLAFIWIPIFIILGAIALFMLQEEFRKKQRAQQSNTQWISGTNTIEILPHANPDNPALQTPMEDFK